MIKDNHKKWSVRKTREILELREDKTNLTKLESLKKKDDVSDCVLMIQAYVIMNLI